MSIGGPHEVLPSHGLLDTLLGDDLPAAHPALWADPRHLALT